MATRSTAPTIQQSIYPYIRSLRLARQEGLEPPTNGFGDRYSTN
jgi:hypothetical protein